MPNYTKKQILELYNALPEDLKGAASSRENSRNIQEICEKNEIADRDTIFEIIKNTGYVFLGLLPPNEFSYILQKELKIKKDRADQISSEIIRFVFLPVKTSLETLYGIKIKPSVKPGTDIATPTEAPVRKKQKPKKSDVYREPITE